MISDFDSNEVFTGNFKIVINGFILGIFNQEQIKEMTRSLDNAID